MVTVPAVTPVTTPEPDPTVAMVISLLLHTPPEVASLNVVVRPGHTLVVPVIDGNALITDTVDIA